MKDADLSGADLRGARDIDVDQLSVARTLYNAKVDSSLAQAIIKRKPELLTKSSHDLALALEQIAIHGKSRDLSMQLAVAYYASGKTDEAEQIYRDVLKQNPSDVSALNNLGYQLIDTQPAQAVPLLQRALQLDSSSAEVQDSLGWAYFKTGHLTEAQTLLETVVKAEPAKSASADHLGDVYRAQNKHQKAVQAWDRALAGDRRNINAEEVTRKTSR